MCAWRGDRRRRSNTPRPAGGADDVPEIKVEGDEDAILCDRTDEKIPIGQCADADIARMDCVVTLSPQPVRHCRRQVHIEQKPHSAAQPEAISSRVSHAAYPKA
jgi:hypothetical protein